MYHIIFVTSNPCTRISTHTPTNTYVHTHKHARTRPHTHTSATPTHWPMHTSTHLRSGFELRSRKRRDRQNCKLGGISSMARKWKQRERKDVRLIHLLSGKIPGSEVQNSSGNIHLYKEYNIILMQLFCFFLLSRQWTIDT